MYVYKKISKYCIFILQVVCGYWVMGSTKANLSWQIGAMRFVRPMCSCGFLDRVPMGIWIFKFLCYRGLTFSNPWVGTYSGDHMLLLSICTNLYTFRSTTFFLSMYEVEGSWGLIFWTYDFIGFQGRIVDSIHGGWTIYDGECHGGLNFAMDLP